MSTQLLRWLDYTPPSASGWRRFLCAYVCNLALSAIPTFATLPISRGQARAKGVSTVDILISSIGVVVGLASIYALGAAIVTRKRGRAIVDETRLDALRRIEQAHQSPHV